MKTAILHYSAPPVVGGVESVIQAQVNQFVASQLPIALITGRGDATALPASADFILIKEIDTLFPEIAEATTKLNRGIVPDSFAPLVHTLTSKLRPIVSQYDHLIVHNVLTKHFNLPLSVSLFQLLEEGSIRHIISWCHDLSWSSPNSRSKVFQGYPWSLLHTQHERVTYVAVSEQRKQEIVNVFHCEPDKVHVIYNGVDPVTLLALSSAGVSLIERMNLWNADMILLMPVRVTKAKNIEFALHVVSAIKEKGRKIKLILTGPPDPHDQANMAYYESLLDLRKRLDLEDDMNFVFEYKDLQNNGLILDQQLVSELYRVSDAVFMPSLREGFGMPILEGALVGLPIIASAIPAAQELAPNQLLIIPTQGAELVANQILEYFEKSPENQLKVKVRQKFTWKAIFERDLLPLLKKENPLAIP